MLFEEKHKVKKKDIKVFVTRTIIYKVIAHHNYYVFILSFNARDSVAQPIAFMAELKLVCLLLILFFGGESFTWNDLLCRLTHLNSFKGKGKVEIQCILNKSARFS